MSLAWSASFRLIDGWFWSLLVWMLDAHMQYMHYWLFISESLDAMRFDYIHNQHI